MAIEYAEKGYNVVISARRTYLLEAIQDDINTKGCNAFAVACDVTDTTSDS